MEATDSAGLRDGAARQPSRDGGGPAGHGGEDAAAAQDQGGRARHSGAGSVWQHLYTFLAFLLSLEVGTGGEFRPGGRPRQGGRHVSGGGPAPPKALQDVRRHLPALGRRRRQEEERQHGRRLSVPTKAALARLARLSPINQKENPTKPCFQTTATTNLT